MNKLKSPWIFVSHSHHDLEKVREIRDYLERCGGNPILFFLKCLNDKDPRLHELIMDEIKARDWFVLCDSPNARASKYVAKEVALVQTEKPLETIVTIDLMEELEPQYPKLDRLLKRATVFLSYAQQDRSLAERIRRTLEQHDYAVWHDAEISRGDYLGTAIRSGIDDAVARGFVLVLLSPASFVSRFCKEEIEHALQLAARSQRSNVIPLVVSPFTLGDLPPHLANIKWFDLTIGSFDERIEELIRNLKIRDME